MNHTSHSLIWLIGLLWLSSLVSSCYKYDPIRDKQNRQRKEQVEPEPPNPEPDPNPIPTKSPDTRILSFDFDETFMAGHTRIDHEKHTISVPVLVRTDLRSLKPILRLADRASLLSPVLGQALDFNLPRRFIVQAEDGSQADYLVRVLPTDPSLPSPGGGGGTTEPDPTDPEEPTPQTVDYTFSFESWSTASRPLPIATAPFAPNFWASASNTGYALAPGKVEPYPVVPYTNGYKGSAVQLKSRPAKQLFGMGTYLVAASLFSGTVDESAMMSRPLESTLFGQAITQTPLSLSGYYQYKAGPKFIDGNIGADAVIAGEDKGTIAVVFFEVNGPNDYLNGKNLYTDSRIVAMGRIELTNTSSGWQKFKLQINPTNADKYKAIDFSSKRYKAAIIFSSSYKGDLYQGAVDSQLLIDEVTLTCLSQ